MRFNLKLGRGGQNCRAKADVERNLTSFFLHICETGINTVRWQQLPGYFKICRWKSKLPADLAAFDHATGNCVRPSEHLARRVKISRANYFTNPRAAHNLSVQRNRRKSVNLEIQFAAKLFQQRDVAAAF